MKCILNDIEIDSIATYLPRNILEMNRLCDLYGESNVKSVMNATGVERVHIADVNETASDMCFEAAQYLIEQENINVDEIDGLIFISQTPDYIAPATSVILQSKLGFSEETVCFDISYGCSGYIYGLFQASILISSGSCKKVMLLAGDTTSKFVNPKDRSQRMVFGDCGSATLIRKGKGNMGFHICSNGDDFDKVIIPAGGFKMPFSAETKKEIVDRDGSIRTLQDLYMDSAAVFNFIVKSGKSSIETILDFMNWNKDEIDLFALHQATRYTINYLRKRLGISEEKAPTNVANYGNTGPTTIPLLLCDLYNKDLAIEPGSLKKVILSAYGIGLSWGSIACDLSSTSIYKPLIKTI
jgi:3-oxoacyl-[acyl-carrier-protein] synthase III